MEKLIQTLRQRRTGILFILKVIPPDLWNWKPSNGMRTMSELANHIACSPIALFKVFQGQIPDSATYLTLEETNKPTDAQGLVQLYETGLNQLISYLETHIEEVYLTNIQLFYEEHSTSMYQEVFNDIGHCWFHLGQLFVYLRQKGVPVEMGTYYGYKDPDPNMPPNE